MKPIQVCLLPPSGSTLSGSAPWKPPHALPHWPAPAHPVSQVTLGQYQREAKQSQVALQRAEDRAEQKEAEVGELQRRLLGMETVTAGVLLFSTHTPGLEGAGGLPKMVAETFLFLAVPEKHISQLRLEYCLALKEWEDFFKSFIYVFGCAGS